MFDWLFNGSEMINATKNMLIAVGVIILIGLLIFCLYKSNALSPFMKIFSKVVVLILFVVLTLSGVYSVLYLNSYYKKQGGIYGQLSKQIYNSIKMATPEDEQETLIYSFDNLTFKSDENEKYSITFIQDYKNENLKAKFLEGEKYSVFVINNGEKYECNNIVYDTDWIHSNYSYVFYKSFNEEVIASDTLTFDFCFYENYSYLKITSEADYTTIQLWNAYFQKYNFQIEIKTVDDVFIPDDLNKDIIEGFVQIKYVIGTLPVVKEIYSVNLNGESVIPDVEFTKGNYYIKAWKDENGNIISSISRDTSANITLYADIVDVSETLVVNFYNYDGSLIETKNYLYNDRIDYVLDSSYLKTISSEKGYKCEFVCWSDKTVYIDHTKTEHFEIPIYSKIENVTESCSLYPVISITNTIVRV